MKVSVLINNYNYARYLGQAIDSILAQTYPDVELVVVDDGSTDDSVAIIQSYGDRIHAVLKENGGQASAMNMGFAHSTGEIIMLLDADDCLHPEAAAKVASIWKPETGALFHRLRIIDENGKETGDYLPDQRNAMSSGNVVPEMLAHGGRYNFPPTSGMSFSRKILEKVMPIPEQNYRTCADDYLRVMVPFLTPITVLDDHLAYYRVHSSNTYGGSTPRRLITGKMIEYRKHVRDMGCDFFKKVAASHNLVVPESSSPCIANDLFEELLLGRSTRQMKLDSRLKMSWANLRLMQAEHVPISALVRHSVILLLVCLAPRSLLSRFYPNLFSK